MRRRRRRPKRPRRWAIGAAVVGALVAGRWEGRAERAAALTVTHDSVETYMDSTATLDQQLWEDRRGRGHAES